MEEGIKKIDGVTYASINFFAQKLTIEAADEVFNKVVDEAAKVCKKIEPDCQIVR
ncbi:MAG: heavy-metal-associated domain-containing protein [Lachnospiraceae bacterium]|nr:heavy-metal-associated domain-containing protein [Lachnospiraceae bacterium]